MSHIDAKRNEKATKSMTNPTINNVSALKTLFIKNSLNPAKLLEPNTINKKNLKVFFKKLNVPLLFNLRQNLKMVRIK